MKNNILNQLIEEEKQIIAILQAKLDKATDANDVHQLLKLLDRSKEILKTLEE